MLLYLTLLVSGAVSVDPTKQDPKLCVNQFEYEYNVLQKLLQFEMIQKNNEEAFAHQQAILSAVMKKMEEINTWMTTQKPTAGSVYTRWGRTSCPNGTELVYAGWAGGSYFNHQGGAANRVCLPKVPEWSYYEDSVGTTAYMYGAEYELGLKASNKFFPNIDQAKSIKQRDVPCAVCWSPRASVITVPAKTNCPVGWCKQYSGYLMAGQPRDKSASEYVCMDDEPETVDGGYANENGALFYMVEARCGSLKCPPYVNGRELTCVVCCK